MSNHHEIKLSPQTQRIFDPYTELELRVKEAEILKRKLKRLDKKMQFLSSEMFEEMDAHLGTDNGLHILRQKCAPDKIVVCDCGGIDESEMPEFLKNILGGLR